MNELGALPLLEIQDLITSARTELTDVQSELERARQQLTAEERAARKVLADLNAQVLDVRTAVDAQEVGLYDFEHPAESSAELQVELAAVRRKIKEALRKGQAAHAMRGFTFNDSAAKGRTLVSGLVKTMLAAYNAEAENAIKTVRAGGLSTAVARLNRVVDRVAQNGKMVELRIAPAYHKLRVKELELAAKHAEAVQVEREVERERRAELREQKRVEDALRKERAKLDKELEHYRNAAAALRDRGDTGGLAELEAKVAEIEQAVSDVDYRAANVRAGYVYVISNIGSFGETVVKIGMTRRLDPMDRVKELGDASVPFTFDVHALFFSDDAFGVEAMLRRHFADRRVNRINRRREFFYTTPAEVLAVLRQEQVAVVQYRTEADAREYRMSQAVYA